MCTNMELIEAIIEDRSDCNSEDSNLTIREYLDYLFNSPEPKIVKYVSESDSDSDNGPKTIEETDITVILESDFSCTPPSTTPLPCQTYAETDLDVDLHMVGQGNNMELIEAIIEDRSDCNSEDSNLTIREYLDYLFNSPEPKIVKYVSESDLDSDNGPETIEETETTVILESDFSCTPPPCKPLPCETYTETDLDVDLHIVGQGKNKKLKEAVIEDRSDCNSEDSNLTIREYEDYLCKIIF